MRKPSMRLLLCGACLYATAANAQTAPSSSSQQQTLVNQTQQGTTNSACLAQQKGLEAELAAIDKMTSAAPAQPEEKPRKKSKVEKVIKAVAGAAVSVILPPAANTILQAGQAAAKGGDESEKTNTKSGPETEQASSTPAAPAAEVPALLTRRQELELRLTAIKQGVCTP